MKAISVVQYLKKNCGIFLTDIIVDTSFKMQK